MDIRQCKRCSNLFDFRGNFNCAACVQALDEIFVNVRNFLGDNPQANMEDVCEACGAEEEDVLRWLREGRLLLSQESTPMLTCQICRSPVKSGRYCEDCALKVIGQLENTAQHLGTRAGGSGRSGKSAQDKEGRIHVRSRER